MRRTIVSSLNRSLWSLKWWLCAAVVTACVFGASRFLAEVQAQRSVVEQLERYPVVIGYECAFRPRTSCDVPREPDFSYVLWAPNWLVRMCTVHAFTGVYEVWLSGVSRSGRVGDRELAAIVPLLKELRDLEVLDLSHTTISDQGLLLLRDLHQLRFIVMIEGTAEVSAEAFAELKEQLPHLGVIRVPAAIKPPRAVPERKKEAHVGANRLRTSVDTNGP